MDLHSGSEGFLDFMGQPGFTPQQLESFPMQFGQLAGQAGFSPQWPAKMAGMQDIPGAAPHLPTLETAIESGTSAGASPDAGKASRSTLPEIDTSMRQMDEKERHKVRQRVRRSKINSILAQLKELVPQCKAIEGESKKKKIEQTQLLEMAVAYIEQLQAEVKMLKKQNEVLLNSAPITLDPTESIISYRGSSDDASSVYSDELLLPSSSPLQTASEPSSPEHDISLDAASLDLICGKRRVSEVYDEAELAAFEIGRPSKMVSGARVVMCLFLFSLLLYNPLSYPAPAMASNSSAALSGRVIQSLATTNPASVSTFSWLFYLVMSVLAKIFMLLMWVFAALLLDHAYVSSEHKIALAKHENDLGVKSFDRGELDESRKHFHRSLAYLGHHAPFYFTTRLFHIPLELVRQVTHLLRIGLWCDGYLVRIRGGQAAMLEVARAHHYLFTLNILGNTMDSHSVLHFLISLNAAESLYQKPPLLAEVYATVGVALYGLCSMPTAYKHFLAKAWDIVNKNMETRSTDGSNSVDSTIAYLLFLSSYGTLCEGNLKQAEAQIVESMALFRKKGKNSMWKYGQFLLAYTSFLRGDYRRSIMLIDRTDMTGEDDPRILWWKEVVLGCCKLGTGAPMTHEMLSTQRELYAQVKVHLSLVPATELLHNSVQSYQLLHLNEPDAALKSARKALAGFVNSTFSGWIFYCGYYIGEVLFAVWADEKAKKNKAMCESMDQSSRMLCEALRRVAKECELARPISLLAEGEAASLRDDHELASQYLQRAAMYADKLDMPMYQAQAEAGMKREMRIVCQQNMQAQVQDSVNLSKLPVWQERMVV
mmetsp:Transcript_17567/g.68137  ORF Transcript_17567/g.68137 Transcript_17567/m.68137 type:complete len:825 (-) Transcript_17567:73-2547(-)